MNLENNRTQVHSIYVDSERFQDLITPSTFREAMSRIPTATQITGDIQNFSDELNSAYALYRLNGETAGGSIAYAFRETKEKQHEEVSVIGNSEQRRDLEIILKSQGLKLINDNSHGR